MTSIAGFQAAATGFQAGPRGFQQELFSGGSSGSAFGISTVNERVVERFEKEAKQTLDKTPKKVVEAVKEAAAIPGKKHDREKVLRRELKERELRYQRRFMELVEQLRAIALEEELRQAFEAQRLEQQREDDALIMVLLM